MIRDFKFDPEFGNRRKRRARRRMLLAAFIVLGGTAGVVRFLEPEALLPTAGLPETSGTEIPTALQVTPLALPQAPTVSAAAAPAKPVAPAPVQVLPLPPRPSAPAATVDSADSAPSLLAASAPAPAATPAVTPVPAEPATPTNNRVEAPPTTLPVPAVAPGEPTTPAARVAEVGPVEPTTVAEPSWSEYEVRSGDSLAAIFKKRQLSPSLLHRIVNSSKTAKKLASIRPGHKLRFLTDEDGELRRLVLVRDQVRSLVVQINEDDIQAEEVIRDVEARVASAAGLIESSLFVDGQKAGLSDTQIMELAAIFGWDVDFSLEIRAGDTFRVLYEEQFLDGRKFRNGPILAAEFVNRGTVYQAVRYADTEGDANYYDPDGRSKRRAFIRSPLKFGRVTSTFQRKRWHPKLKRWRAHRGVDYGAPTGTPIRATGAGKVTFRGTKGGYGRTVIIQHGSKYQTLYAHLSKYSRKARSGSKVKQGQIIGYVGASGLATGPHLHYEFRVNGVHRNPLTVKLPKSQQLPKSQLEAFRAQTSPLLAQLDAVEGQTLVAQAEQAEKER